MGGQGDMMGGIVQQMQRGQIPQPPGGPSILGTQGGEGRMSIPQQPMPQAQGGGKSGGMQPMQQSYANSGLGRFGSMPMYQPPAYQPAIFQPPQLAPAQNMQTLFPGAYATPGQPNFGGSGTFDPNGT